MDMQIKSEFVSLWRKYFNDAELPVTFYYSNRTKEAPARPGTIARCVAPNIIFKRWDNLAAEDEPEIIIFFAQPDVLSGLFTLANYDIASQDAVFTPMSSGCATIISYPYLEKNAPNPRAVIGMFDPSARPFVSENMLSFSVSMKRFVAMMKNMAESFLITDTWKEIQKRIKTNP